MKILYENVKTAQLVLGSVSNDNIITTGAIP